MMLKVDGRMTNNFMEPVTVHAGAAGTSSQGSKPALPSLEDANSVTSGADANSVAPGAADVPLEPAEEAVEMSMGMCIKTAPDLLHQMGGMDLMAGFHRELQSALESANAIKGPMQSNLPCCQVIEALGGPHTEVHGHH